MKNIERFQIISGTAGEIETQVGEALASHPNMQILNVCACVRRKSTPDLTKYSDIPANIDEFREDKAEVIAIDISDAAKTLAEAHGIDLTKVTGTGTKGTIKVSDVQAAIEANAASGEAPEAPEATETPQPAATLQAIDYEEEVIITYSLAIVG
jgi:pyruvate/2-oxoglutarate dehydrogenase complex dihydrolipoamide acyltransferase (E2) component